MGYERTAGSRPVLVAFKRSFCRFCSPHDRQSQAVLEYNLAEMSLEWACTRELMMSNPYWTRQNTHELYQRQYKPRNVSFGPD